MHVTALVQKLEESIKVNSYLVKEKLPKEIATQKKFINDLQKIISRPAFSQSDLDQIHDKVYIYCNCIIKTMFINDTQWNLSCQSAHAF